MPTVFYDGYNYNKHFKREKFNKSLHIKDKRRRHDATIKKSDINTFVAVGDYGVSNKDVDRDSRMYKDRFYNYFHYPKECNCCWKNGTKWYRRHHRDLMQKGKNKSRHKRRFRPSYLSHFDKNQMIKDEFKFYLYN